MVISKYQLIFFQLQSPMGWHVMKLEDSHQMQKPSFKEAKPRLSEILQMVDW